MTQEVLLYTQNISAATAEIASKGGQITQQLSSDLIVANIPKSINLQDLTESTITIPDDLDEISKVAFDAWSGLELKRSARGPMPAAGLPWDAPGYQSPRKIANIPSEGIRGADEIEESTGTPTSLYMIGSVAVGIVIVGGVDPSLKFSAAEQTKVVQEVQEGLSFLANAEPRANISFVYDIRFVEVNVPPVSTEDPTIPRGTNQAYERREAPWRNAALTKMGFAGNRQGSIDYVRQLRTQKATDWAYVAYFTKYPLHHFAYAVSEKLCMEYANDNWGVDSINQVFAHETCHLFGAADEYGNCICGGSNGFLGIPNNNCVNCAGTHERCLMERNELVMCQWTRGQIGWRDSLFPGTAITPPTPPIPPTDPIPTLPRFRVTTDLRLRSGPGTNFNIIEVMPVDTEVDGGSIDGTWMEIDVDGDGSFDGWAATRFLEPI